MAEYKDDDGNISDNAQDLFEKESTEAFGDLTDLGQEWMDADIHPIAAITATLTFAETIMHKVGIPDDVRTELRKCARKSAVVMTEEADARIEENNRNNQNN